MRRYQTDRYPHPGTGELVASAPWRTVASAGPGGNLAPGAIGPDDHVPIEIFTEPGVVTMLKSR